MPRLALNGGRPVRDLPKSEWPRATEADIQAVVEALRSGPWCRIGGDRAYGFETEFAAFQGAKYGIAVSSGTAALELGLLALGIQPGGEVIMSPYTWVANPNSVLICRGVPVFVDIEPDTYNIDPARIEAAITDQTFAIVAVHFGGRVCDMDRIVEIARRHNLKVIEDASHAHGGKWRGQGVGSIGDVGTFSFATTKNLTAGEGGLLLTNDESTYWRAANLADVYSGGLVQRAGERSGEFFIAGKDGTFTQVAPNFRFSEILAALLSSRLTRLEEETQTRSDNADYLNELLSRCRGIKTLPKDPRITRNAYHIFIFRYLAEEFGGLPRELFVDALKAEGIPASTGYRRPLNRQPAYSDEEGQKIWPYNKPVASLNVDYGSASCPNAEFACQKQAVWLPTGFMLDAGRTGMEQVVEAVEKIRANVAELIGAAAISRG